MVWKEAKQEIKKSWLLFLFFGLIIIIINTLIQVPLTNYLNSKWEGPPCRVDFPVGEFTVDRLKTFGLGYLLINMHNKDLLIERIDAFCYWKNEEQIKIEKELVFLPPSIEQISEPTELEKVDSSKSVVKRANCLSPKEPGRYAVRIIVQTTSGQCVGENVMNVK